ncbi:uncharacterized protein LOC117335804 [Pecten maximus]|uniref:uncharacterized protein LOC117335804 n=1 Tax=Pecten maximus TaxID=6579 RepID=UPI0014587349|nr:uncharacterized protein LOC117335804 [Pecten maximus]
MKYLFTPNLMMQKYLERRSILKSLFEEDLSCFKEGRSRPSTTEDQPRPSTEDQPKPSTEDQPPPSTEDQPQPSIEDQSPPSTEDQSQPSIEDQSQPSTEDQSRLSTEDQPQPSTEDQSRPSTEDQSRPSTEDQPQPSTEDQSRPSTEDQSRPSTEDQSQPSTEDQPRPSTEDQSRPSTEDQSRPSTEDQPQPSTEDQPPPSIEDQSPPSTEDQSQPYTEDQSQPSTEDQPRPSTEDQSRPSTEDQSRPSIEDQSQPYTEDQPRPSTEDQSRPSTEDQSRPSTEDQSRPSIEDQSRPSIEDQSQPSTEDQSRPSIEDQSRPSTEDQSRPSTEDQSQPYTEDRPRPSTEDRPRPSTEDQPRPSTEDQSRPSTEDQSRPSTEDQPQPSTEDQPPPSIEDQSPPSTEDQSQPYTEDQSQPYTEDQPRPSTEDQSRPSTEDQSRPSIEDQSQPYTEDQPRPSTEDQSRPSTEDQSRPSTEDQSRPSIEDQSRPSIEDQSQPSTEDQSRPSIEDQSRPSTEDQSRPSTEDQSRPSTEDQSQPYTEDRPRPSTEDQPQSSATVYQYSVLTSGLNKSQKDEVQIVCRKFGWVFFDSYHPKITHLIMRTEPEESRMCDRSLKFLQGITQHVFIVNLQWIRDAGNTGAPLSEENYEIIGDTASMEMHQGPYLSRTQPSLLLLKGFNIHLIGQAEDLTKDDLKKFIIACGGTVIGASEVCQDSVIVTCYNHEGEDIDVLSPDERDEVKRIYMDYGLPAVSRDWIIDSLTCYVVHPIDEYIHMDHRESTERGCGVSSPNQSKDGITSDTDEDGNTSDTESKLGSRGESSSNQDEDGKLNTSDTDSKLGRHGKSSSNQDEDGKLNTSDTDSKKRRHRESSYYQDEDGKLNTSDTDSKKRRHRESSSNQDEDGKLNTSDTDSKLGRHEKSSSNQDEDGKFNTSDTVSKKRRRRHEDFSSDLDEEDITRDVNIDTLYIRKYKVKKPRLNPGQSKGVRIYDNYHACYFCEKVVLHINEHLKTHRNQDTVKNILNSDNPDFTLLRKLGDDRHNRKKVEMKKGEIILARRPKGKFDVTEYGPCPDCREWVMLDHIKLHHKHCQIHRKTSVKTKRKDLVFQAQVLAGHVKNEPSSLMSKEVLPIMTRDVISKTAQNDQLIMALGESWLRRNRGNPEKRKYYASTRMRLCARLILALPDVKSDEKTDLKDGNEGDEDVDLEEQVPKADDPKGLWCYLKPKHFDDLVLAAVKCAIPNADDEEDLLAPSNAIKLKYDLHRLINSKWAMIVKNGSADDEEARGCKTLRALMDLEWGEKVTRFARLVLARRKYEYKNELPSLKDIEQITKFLMKELNQLELAPRNFRRLVILCQARLLLYNKRRSGEVETIKLQCYASRSRSSDDIDESLESDLTPVERHLLESQEFLRVRGKRGRPVPVIIPPDVGRVLTYLADTDGRHKSGIVQGNPYLFPNSVNYYARAYESVKSVCAELDLHAPHQITSVNMRKYMATLTQMMNLEKHQLEWVYNHLGHTKKVHREHYRQMSGLVERTQISKLLLVQDLNLTSKFQGKKLDDLDIRDIVLPDEETHETQHISDHLSVPVQNLMDPEECLYAEAAANEESAEEKDEEDEELEEVEKKKKAPSRQRWTAAETEELKEIFGDFLKSKTTPRQAVVEKMKKKSKKGNGVLHLRANHLIIKKISNMNHAKL